MKKRSFGEPIPDLDVDFSTFFILIFFFDDSFFLFYNKTCLNDMISKYIIFKFFF